MDITEIIYAGMKKDLTFIVEEDQTAKHIGSGGSRVLATPWMIAFMERTCHRLLAEHLPNGYSSVGVLVNIRHLAPTPVGSEVRVSGEVLQVDGLKVNFAVEAWDDQEKIGLGNHERFVIDTERFLERVYRKVAPPKT